jgi:hypothetical protein
MTAWAGGGKSTDFVGERIKAIGAEDGIKGFARTFTGLVELNGALLVRLSELTGKTEEQLLQELALRYQSL